MLIGLLIRIILLPFSKKTLRQSENMKKANPELQRLEKKYENKTDNESMMAKSQEMMMIYKKYNISPAGSCLLAFIQLPLFFAFLQAINRVPAIFEDSFLGLKLGMTPAKGFSVHQYGYIILIALIILTTYFSFKDSMTQSSGNSEAEKQMQFTMKFMIVMISFASFSLPTAIALYWIVTNGFIIIQNKILKKWIAYEDQKDKIIKPNKNGKNKKRGK
jgi:YidC/Oxa1 family membrane protein insertase